MQTHDLPRDYFWGVMKYPDWVNTREVPFVEVGSSAEIEHPHRWGVSLVVRLLFGRALVVGQWLKQAHTDDEVTAHLERAVSVDAFGITEPGDEEMAAYGYDAEGDAMRPIGEW